MKFVIAAVIALATSAFALYDESSFVVKLTAENFKELVLDDDSIWVVHFYAPWSGHCKALKKAYIEVAEALKGRVKVGAVDGTVGESDERGRVEVWKPFYVTGGPSYPTIMIFGRNKQAPIHYLGERSAEAIAEAAIDELNKSADIPSCDGEL